MVLPTVIMHEIVFCTCAQPLVMHKLACRSMNIHDTVICACIRVMAKHKVVFSSVKIPYTVHRVYSRTSEVHELDIP